MFNSTPSEPLFEMLPYAGGIFGIGLLLFGLLVFGLIAAAVVAFLFKRKSALAPAVPVAAQSNTINLADGIDADELQRIQRILAEQTEREKEAATREKILTALGTEKATAAKK